MQRQYLQNIVLRVFIPFRGHEILLFFLFYDIIVRYLDSWLLAYLKMYENLWHCQWSQGNK